MAGQRLWGRPLVSRFAETRRTQRTGQFTIILPTPWTTTPIGPTSSGDPDQGLNAAYRAGFSPLVFMRERSCANGKYGQSTGQRSPEPRLNPARLISVNARSYKECSGLKEYSGVWAAVIVIASG